MHRNSVKLAVGQPGAGPAWWLGANFWSRAGGPFMWRGYDPALVRSELAVLARHGLNVTRSFFFWPDFMPAPDRIDPEMTARFADFLDRHAEAGMATIPTFVVGHMSGENWDPAWRNGRDLYSDVWMVARQAWFAGEMTRRFASHPAVAGWLVSNEMPLYGGVEGAPEVVASWAQLIRDAVRANGGTQPFSLGDGAWGIEVRGQENGFRLADTARLCDFIGPHVYPLGDDPVRVHHAAAWECELAGTFGRPVILEEFGVSSDFASGPAAASYYRQVLHNSLAAGASGWLAWNNTDFDGLESVRPYQHKSFELHFGLTDVSGNPKPQLGELHSFGQTLRAIGFPGTRRSATGTALVIPAYLEAEYPFAASDDRGYIAQTLAQAYVSARLADLAPAIVREAAGLRAAVTARGTARLYLMPSVKQVLATTLTELDQLAADGACGYLSYCGGTGDWHRGPSYGRLNEVFGVTHQLRPGLADPVTDDLVTFTFRREFGGIPAGGRLSFRAGGNEHSRAYLPVLPDEAEVIAEDQHGRPALLLRRTGAGSLVLCTYPVEHMAAVTPRVNPDDCVTLLDALAVHAGVSRPVLTGDNRVSADLLEHEDGRRFTILVSQADEPITVKASAPGLDEVTLEPSGAAVLPLTS